MRRLRWLSGGGSVAVIGGVGWCRFAAIVVGVVGESEEQGRLVAGGLREQGVAWAGAGCVRVAAVEVGGVGLSCIAVRCWCC